MRINKLYDIILTVEEYELLNEIAELGRHIFGFGDEMRLIIGEDDFDNIMSQVEDYLYSENSIRGSERYERIGELYSELNEVNY